MDAVLDKVCRRLIASVERHEGRCRINSLTAFGGSTIKINYKGTKSVKNLSANMDDREREIERDTEGMHDLRKHLDEENLRYAVNH